MKAQLSILIPTRNRRDRLLKTLESLREQTLAPEQYEVIVVSDGSTDGSEAAVRSLAGSPEWSSHSLVCVEQEWGGAAAARNRALQIARGEIVLFLDDDVLASPELVEAHLRCHEVAPSGSIKGIVSHSRKVVLGHILPDVRSEAIHRQMRGWWLDHYGRLSKGKPTFMAFFTGNVSLPREAAVEAGGFDESIDYGEDIEFGYRLSLLGLEFSYEARAQATTSNLKSGEGLLMDMYRLGRGCVRIYHKMPETLPALALSAYGETNLRMRVTRGLLLLISRNSHVERILNRGFVTWADKHEETAIDRQLFELARSYYFWLGVRQEVKDKREWLKLTSPGVAVLTYHSVEPSREQRGSERYSVETGRFFRQMALLRLLGYKVAPLTSLVDTWKEGKLPPPRTVAITFDDGYRDNMLHAWPVLRRFGYAATLFFVSGLAGETSVWDMEVEGGPRPLLTHKELRKLDRDGFKVEAHTVSHPDLPKISPQAAVDEIKRSRLQLETILERPVELFAYPYGHHNSYLEEEVENAGYKAAFSVKRGLNTLRTERYALKRVTISGDDSLLMFALKVLTGDDPLKFIPGFQRITDRKFRAKSKLLAKKVN